MSDVLLYALFALLGFLGGITLATKANCKLKIEGAETERELMRVMDTLDDIIDEIEVELRHQNELNTGCFNESLYRFINKTRSRLEAKSKVLRKILYPLPNNIKNIYIGR